MFLNTFMFFEQRVILEHEADVALLHGDVVDALAADENVAGGGHFQPGDHAQHGGLAAAAGPEQRHQLAFLHGKGDVVDGGDLAEFFADVFQFDAHFHGISKLPREQCRVTFRHRHGCVLCQRKFPRLLPFQKRFDAQGDQRQQRQQARHGEGGGVEIRCKASPRATASFRSGR